MYEFLAPWGVFVPAISALIIYFRISAARRNRMMKTIEAPEEKCRNLISRITRSRNITRSIGVGTQ